MDDERPDPKKNVFLNGKAYPLEPGALDRAKEKLAGYDVSPQLEALRKAKRKAMGMPEDQG